MINFHYEIPFNLDNEKQVSDWISETILSENLKEGEINYIFCSDDYLHKINVEFLNHDTLTDIISFDYSAGKELHGDIYVSVDRVKENAETFATEFTNEMARVIIHGILHFCGYKDKSEDEEKAMRSKEDFYLAKRS
ncbi:rRNA maturation RNase YbeY [Winogradskyella maritima]|uniref:Endoribonuclease YbeY n=1 Tax=Winogradskyella maritima TaxID=1517766 RepID=A0ABV8AEY8_9FLAO|nr:rRNA maturation RNase YbeY [Winogradskyella maritima]